MTHEPHPPEGVCRDCEHWERHPCSGVLAGDRCARPDSGRCLAEPGRVFMKRGGDGCPLFLRRMGAK